MLYMQSTNANDGTMTLTVTFDIDTNPNIDQVNVQNRVSQAQPNLPADVNQFWSEHAQVNGNTYAGNCNLFAAANSRLTFSRELREHKHQRRTLSCFLAWVRFAFRGQRLRDAHLGQT